MANDTPLTGQTTLWAGTYHGRHGGTPVTVTATRDDTRAQPYAWMCTCGASRHFATEYGLGRSAWRHTHPTAWTRMRQWTARLLRRSTTAA
ncbi:hypothetical protein [Streptomyces chrestomyceticus]|uniref:hypothetical protein n=1 Tax=Streptomyces chrestomyceticus TaxID=68185 RepID=UPI0035A86097